MVSIEGVSTKGRWKGWAIAFAVAVALSMSSHAFLLRDALDQWLLSEHDRTYSRSYVSLESMLRYTLLSVLVEILDIVCTWLFAPIAALGILRLPSTRWTVRRELLSADSDHW